MLRLTIVKVRQPQFPVSAHFGKLWCHPQYPLPNCTSLAPQIPQSSFPRNGSSTARCWNDCHHQGHHWLFTYCPPGLPMQQFLLVCLPNHSFAPPIEAHFKFLFSVFGMHHCHRTNQSFAKSHVLQKENVIQKYLQIDHLGFYGCIHHWNTLGFWIKCGWKSHSFEKSEEGNSLLSSIGILPALGTEHW